MAKVTYVEPYATVQGKFSKASNLVNKLTPLRKQIAHRHGYRNLKDRPYSNDEETQHSNFSKVAKNVSARMKQNSPTYVADLAAFAAQRDTANGYKRFRPFLWHDEMSKL